MLTGAGRFDAILRIRCQGLAVSCPSRRETKMHACSVVLKDIWYNDRGQDVAEYAVMLAVILVIVVGTIKLIGGKANNVFSGVASSIQ